MVKMFRKIFVMLLAITVAFAAVGCDGCNNGGSSANNGPTISTLQPEAPEINMPAASNLVVGGSYTLRPQLRNIDGPLTWKSSDPTIATVTDGVIKAVNEGTATITAEYGAAVATCVVNATFADYIPTIQTAADLEVEASTFTINNTYPINPYILFNGVAFYDATFEYEVADESVLTVNANNEIETKGKIAGTSVIVKATWKKFNSNDYETLTTSFDVNVSNNVLFYENDSSIRSFDIQTPASFLEASEYNNVYTLKPTVAVDGSTPVAISSENISIQPLEGTEEGVDYVVEGNTITAKRLGKVLVTYKYTDPTSGAVYTDSFNLGFARPTKVLDKKIPYFSALSGFAKDSNLDNIALEQLVWGEDIEIYDAYENGTKLTVSGNGAITGVTSGTDSTIDTTILVGSRTEIYEVPLTVATMFISDKNDVVTSFELEQRHVITRGYFELVKDVDMEEHLMLNTSTNFNRTIGFGGVFDGKGYSISNVRVSLQNATPWDPTINAYPTPATRHQRKGFFNELIEGCIVRNVAFINMIPDSGNGDCGMTGPVSRQIGDGSRMENCYFDIAKDCSLGIFSEIGEKSELVNVVIEMATADNFVFNDARYEAQAAANAYGVSALAYTMHKLNGYNNSGSYTKNLFVVTKKPLAYVQSPLGTPNTDSLVTDYFLYGDNETEFWYDYSCHDGMEFEDVKSYVAHNRYYDWYAPVPDYKTAPAESKVVAKKGIYRYNTYSDIVNDNSDMKNNALVSFNQKYWDISSGAPIWKGAAKRVDVIKSDKEVMLYNETDISLQILGEKIDATFTTSSDLISINNDKDTITGLKVGTNALITATWTNEAGEVCTKDIYVNVIQPKYKSTKLYVEGKELKTFNIEFEINTEKALSVTYKAKPTTITSITSANTERVTVNGNKIAGHAYGESLLTIVFEDSEGVSHTIKYLSVVTKVNVLTSTEVIYDAFNNELMASNIPTSEIFGVSVSAFDQIGKPIANDVLTFDNGGIYYDDNGVLRFRSKLNNTDELPGVPAAGNNDKYAKQIMKFSIETADRLYVYDNVKAYAAYIETPEDLSSLIEYDYSGSAINYGYYVLANDIDATGYTYTATGLDTSGHTVEGFAGEFDGQGYTISNLKQGKFGLFGAFTYDTKYDNVTEKRLIPIKNFALVNLSSNGPAFATSLALKENKHVVQVSNVYISYAAGAKSTGIIEQLGYGDNMLLTNVVIDNSKNNADYTTVKDNKAFGFVAPADNPSLYDNVIAPVVKGSVSYGALFTRVNYGYTGAFDDNVGAEFRNSHKNVIAIGLMPLLPSDSLGTISSAMFTHTKANGVYTHTPKSLGMTGYAAGNTTVGDVAYVVGLKPGFAAIVTNNSGNPARGYVCTTCYNTFSKNAGTCADCNVALTYNANLWTEPGSFIWEVYDLSLNINKRYDEYDYIFPGISKYATAAQMATATNVSYEEFVATGLWKVVDNVLTWKGNAAA